MKLCTCRTCGTLFYVTKNRPFCSGTCRMNYQDKGANRVGATEKETNNG